ncbi:hypothetical protein [Priestia endophytica]|uniref:hypothetical protein n=1 Tax=Priestia endophytica TaxID=135735 RepID=UPI002282F241|nr:hypothetical protein [Priestia endophytica]MCY8235379.1 hypothetical protein [Priestia endophytica]
MNNRRGMMTSLLALGATGAAIYGITRGVRNGTFQQLPQTVSNILNSQQGQQMTNPLQGMTNNQSLQQTVANQNRLS